MKDLELTARIVHSAAQIALAKNITARHQIDNLVGVLSRELLAGKTEAQALETARIAADDMAKSENSNSIIDQLLARINDADALLIGHQALSEGMI